MSAQLELPAHVGPRTTIERDFQAFDRANPHVYRELVRLARVWKERRGIEHCGIKTLYEVARWNLALETTGDSFKLNNSYTALYARKIMAQEPDLRGLFSTRRLRGADPFADSTALVATPSALEALATTTTERTAA